MSKTYHELNDEKAAQSEIKWE